MDQTLIDKTNKLKLYLCCMGLNAKEFALSIDFTPTMISGYLLGKRRLSKKSARLIELATGGAITKEEILNDNPPEDAWTAKKKLEDKLNEPV